MSFIISEAIIVISWDKYSLFSNNVAARLTGIRKHEISGLHNHWISVFCKLDIMKTRLDIMKVREIGSIVTIMALKIVKAK